MSGLRVLSIAPGATIQDRGRPGLLRYGVSPSGPMDGYALAEGRALLDERTDAAALEMAGAGGRFRAEGASFRLALSGARMQAWLNGAKIPWRQAFSIGDGDELRIGAALEGVYGYLHVAGGFLTERALNARATHLRAGFGHLAKAGDLLPATAAAGRLAPVGLARPDYFDRREIRALWGPQSHLFSARDRERLAASRFTVSARRDRMGMQILPEGADFGSESGLSVASDATLPGDIQITGDGTPVILMADRGPTGGYPRIATVIGADLDALAQTPSGESFALSFVTRAEAVDALLEYRRKIRGLVDKVQPVVRDPRDMPDLLSYNLIGGMTTGRNDGRN